MVDMPKCPKCNEEIDHLHLYERFEKKYDYGVESKFFIADVDPDDIEFECPECNEALFDNEDDADAFLKGATNEKEN
jgi:hypothetical protein